MNLWPHLAPGEQTSEVGHVTDDSSATVLTFTGVTAPRLFLSRPDDAQVRPAVIVFPGGGYQILAADLEGSEIAAWLNRQGFVAAVLHYRVPEKRDAAYQDAQRAVSLLRARSNEFGVDPHRVGVLGFSAGGHLAARLASGSGERTYTLVDEADAQGCRPDFALLIYPAYLIADTATGHPAPDVQPHGDMPPVFLTQAHDDPYVTAPAYAAALAAAGVPTHSALYDTGGHGYGLRLPPSEPAHAWADEAARWLQQFQGT